MEGGSAAFFLRPRGMLFHLGLHRDSLSARQYDVGTVCRLLALSDCSCFGGQNLRGIAKAASTHMDQSMTADLVRLLLLNEPLQVFVCDAVCSDPRALIWK